MIQYMVKSIFPALVILSLAACSSVPSKHNKETHNLLDILRGSSSVFTDSLKTKNSAYLRNKRHTPTHAREKIPTILNREVKKWIKYFSVDYSDHFISQLRRGKKAIPMIRSILKRKGIPEEIVYLPIIESGYSNSARSKAGALGMWQLMKGTARDLGLRIDEMVDERRDPVKATIAASNYLKSLYSVFGDWHLALAAYNAGENRIKGVLMREGTRDFWTLVSRKALPRETMNYIPKFIAARMLASNPRKFGLIVPEPEWQEKLASVTIPSPVSLRTVAKYAGLSVQRIREHNPSLVGSLTPYHVSLFTLTLPANNAEYLRRSIPKLSKKRTLALRQIRRRRSRNASSSLVRRGGVSSYRVRRGDTLSHIARKFKSSIRQLEKLNRIKSNRTLKIGQRIRVPKLRKLRRRLRAGKTYRKRSSRHSSKRSVRKSSRRRNYIVQRGDTLIGISQKFGISLRELKRKNRLSHSQILMAGKRLKL